MATPKDYTVYRGVDGVIKASTTKTTELGPKEVLVKITHSGLCGTDLHYIPFGMALGHEGVGIVEAVGSAVTTLKPGDRTGGGFHRNACGHCKYCLSGQDIWCYERSIYGEGDHSNGTLGEYFLGFETFLHRIPDSMASEHAAPLQCAGATVYSALVDVIRPFQRVGIVGIGGLGHLAIQYASKLGAEVVVFSTSRDKDAEAKEFGASEFYLLSETEKLAKPVDILVVAGSRYPDWDKFMVKSVLARNGTVIPLSAPGDTITLPISNMFWEGYSVHMSLVASRARHDDMLAFSAAHGIKPVVEKFELSESGLAEALERLKSNKMRYRGVLVAA